MKQLTIKEKARLGEELAAKVRGYFTDRYGELDEMCKIPGKMNGDRDLYETASKITQKIVQPGERKT